MIRAVRYCGWSSLAAVVLLAGCAARSEPAAGVASPAFNAAGIKSVYVQSPIQVRLRTGGGGDTRALEDLVGDALREHLRRDLGWVSARSAAEADIVVRFQLTDWEASAEGTRVGGVVSLHTPATNAQVFTATSVYPSRFGAPAAGTPAERLPNLFESLFKSLRKSP